MRKAPLCKGRLTKKMRTKIEPTSSVGVDALGDPQTHNPTATTYVRTHNNRLPPRGSCHREVTEGECVTIK